MDLWDCQLVDPQAGVAQCRKTLDGMSSNNARFDNRNLKKETYTLLLPKSSIGGPHYKEASARSSMPYFIKWPK